MYAEEAPVEYTHVVFFFSSRRRHTRCGRDWSSDVCSSDLEGRFWLPFRQEIEIRRRATWLDMPARGIIRGRWEIDGYALNLGLATSWFAGEEITAVPKAERDSFPWTEPLDAAVQAGAQPLRRGGPPGRGARGGEDGRPRGPSGPPAPPPPGGGVSRRRAPDRRGGP